MAPQRKRSAGPVGPQRRSLQELGKSASQVVQEAAAVLEEELATGLIAARKVSQRLAREQRFEAEDFADALRRFQSTGHELLEIVRARLEELGSDSTQELLQKFITDAQGALETLVELIAAGPALANRVLKTETKPRS